MKMALTVTQLQFILKQGYVFHQAELIFCSFAETLSLTFQFKDYILFVMNRGIVHERNRFYKKVDGLDCELEYSIRDNNIIDFYHTYVPEPLRGRGLAMEIIQEGLDFAVAHHYRIIPSCSAVKKFIDRHPEYRSYSL